MATPTDQVEVIRHTHEEYEVVAYDLFGKIVRHRMFRQGRDRKRWAVQQAESWARQLYLWFDGKIRS